MSLFNNMLSSDESLFLNEVALSYEFLPKLLPYREKEQRHAAMCIKPLFNNMDGRNVMIYGAPGIGKTAAIRWVLRDLEEQTDEIFPVYVNCWQKNTAFKIYEDICHQLGYKFTQNRRAEELFKVIQGIVNKKAAVFVFDEVDKLDDFDFVYSLVEGIYKKSIFLITNYKEWLLDLDERIKSRLTAELLEFKQYNPAETKGIMQERKKLAFVPGVWEQDAFELVVNKAAALMDIRSGLHLMKEAGLVAEESSSRKITKEHAEKAVVKLDEFTIKKSTDLEDDTKGIYALVKENPGTKIGDLFKKYQQKEGKSSYRTFQRKIDKLAKNGFISVKKITGGIEGSTTIVNPEEGKKLTDF